MADYTKFMPKTPLIGDDGNLNAGFITYNRLDASSDFSLESFSKGFEVVQALNSGDLRVYSQVMTDSDALLQMLNEGELRTAHARTKAGSQLGLVDFTTKYGSDLGRGIEEKDQQQLLGFGLGLVSNNVLFAGAENMNKYNASLSAAREAQAKLEMLSDPRKAGEFIQGKVDILTGVAQEFFMSIVDKLAGQYQKFEQNRIIRAIAVDYNLPEFIGLNFKQGAIQAKKQREEMQKAGEDDSLEEIVEKYGNAANTIPQVANQFSNLAYQVFNAGGSEE